LKSKWQEEYNTWRRRDLSGKHYIYWWVDGVYLNTPIKERTCVLLIIGATAEGEKELLALEDGYRESEQSWIEILLDLKARGLEKGPSCAVGDGAMGFWKALIQVYGKTRPQRCWMHKTGNVLDKMPKGVQKKAKSDLHEIWMAETKEEAEEAFNLFINKYQAKYPKAVECLVKDRETLLTFYDFPAEHWKHLRTTNPVESTLSTVRLRTDKTRNCGSRITVLSMVFRLFLSAERRWRRLDGVPRLTEVMEGVKFVDGIREEEDTSLGSYTKFDSNSSCFSQILQFTTNRVASSIITEA